MIERRIYGTLGATLPVLGIGCWAFGGGSYWGQQDQKDVNEVVDIVARAGLARKVVRLRPIGVIKG